MEALMGLRGLLSKIYQESCGEWLCAIWCVLLVPNDWYWLISGEEGKILLVWVIFSLGSQQQNRTEVLKDGSKCGETAQCHIKRNS